MPKYKNRKCHFCDNSVTYVDYKNKSMTMRFLTQYGKIVPSYYSGNCVKHQKMLSRAVKNARTMALIPYNW